MQSLEEWKSLNPVKLRPPRCRRSTVRIAAFAGPISPSLPAAALLCALLWTSGCSGRTHAASRVPPPSQPSPGLRAGHAVQVGAFRDLDNAVRLARCLNDSGLDAYYFKHESGLYKVRFGDFDSRSTAHRQAELMRSRGIIEEFFIVGPEAYAPLLKPSPGLPVLRDAIVREAENFLGLPYQWGGESAASGFDCSGFTMAVYNLVGLTLPRSSHAQYAAGIPVPKADLSRGDLVFFRTTGGQEVTHVGIFTGGDRFIHAPGRDKEIRVDSLSAEYFHSRYAGARTFIK